MNKNPKGNYDCYLVILRILIVCSSFFFAGIQKVFATPSPVSSNSDLGPWSVLLYGGGTAKQVYGDVLCGKYNNAGENIYAMELAYNLAKDNLLRQIFEPIFDTVQIAGNFAYRDDYRHHDNVKEGNLYLIWRWTNFPWEQYVSNSLAIGDGVSYDSHPPFANLDENKLSSKWLNYLMIEATFALPSKPSLQLVFRVHHSCTAWGVFSEDAVNAGSTNIGIGIRYYF